MKSEGRREKICEDSEIPDITMEYLSHAENIKIDKLSFGEMKLANWKLGNNITNGLKSKLDMVNFLFKWNVFAKLNYELASEENNHWR